MEPKTVGIIAVVVIAVLALPLILAGGNSKVTVENYNKIQMGMSYDQVKAILGSGERMTFKEMAEEFNNAGGMQLPPNMANMEDPEGLDNYVWEVGDQEGIFVMFIHGAVQMKAHEGIAEESDMQMGDMQQLMQIMMESMGMPDLGDMPMPSPEQMQQMQQQMQRQMQNQ